MIESGHRNQWLNVMDQELDVKANRGCLGQRRGLEAKCRGWTRKITSQEDRTESVRGEQKEG